MYKVLQLTNDSIGAVSVNQLMPLGTITRKICYGNSNCRTFDVSTTGADTITLNEPGNYRISYSASLTAGATGEITVELIANGTSLYSVSSTASAEGEVINITLPYEVRVCPNCSGNINNCPMTIQFKLTGVAITEGTSNVLIERVY